MSTAAAGPRFAVDEQTGEYTVLADRWHTCFFDLDGQQGLLGQVEGRICAGATPTPVTPACWPPSAANEPASAANASNGGAGRSLNRMTDPVEL